MGAILAALLMREPVIPEFTSDFNVPLPPVMHKTITPEDIGNKTVFVIGDVHGCYDELVDLITQEKINPTETVIVFCGDFVNKGPNSLECLRYIRKLGAYSVRGNHEEHVVKYFFKMKNEQSNGVSSTKACENLKQKYKWIVGLTDEEVEYILSLPYTLSMPSLGSIIVHAGFFPWHPLKLQNPNNMILMRNIVDPDGPTPRASKFIDEGLPWASQWTGPSHVYFGHDARRGLQRYRFATGLDTGCIYGNQLTGVYLNGDKKGRFVSVPARKAYRGEKG